MTAATNYTGSELLRLRALRMVMERLVSYGKIPPGVTVYRKSPGVWLELPDPEKVK